MVSVGASASCFGLVGAFWGELVINYVATDCSLRGTKVGTLVLFTLASLIKNRKVSCRELVDLFTERLLEKDAELHFLITLTTERAIENARILDAELAAGTYRGLLHGIPWGAKDLLAVSNYPTTWGAAPFKDRQLQVDAEVVRRLDAAGANLIAKLTMGALAMGLRLVAAFFTLLAINQGWQLAKSVYDLAGRPQPGTKQVFPATGSGWSKGMHRIVSRMPARR